MDPPPFEAFFWLEHCGAHNLLEGQLLFSSTQSTCFTFEISNVMIIRL